MWQKASIMSKDASSSLDVFVETSEFLFQNLKQDEKALVPMPTTFYVMNPELRDKLIEYKSLWDSSGIIFQANTSKEEILKVRSHFIDFLKETPQVKYIVHDWVDPYAKHIFESIVNDELMPLFNQVKIIPFTLSTGWSSMITIYERMHYTPVYAMNFSSTPSGVATLPKNASINYDSNSMTINKVGSRTGIYFPFDREINSSKQNYLTMQIKTYGEDLDLTLVFYYDKNKDGIFSGYDVDYVKTAIFYQNEEGWISNEWYTTYHVVPKAEDPLVQIGIIMNGHENGTLTISKLIVHIQATSDIDN